MAKSADQTAGRLYEECTVPTEVPLPAVSTQLCLLWMTSALIPAAAGKDGANDLYLEKMCKRRTQEELFKVTEKRC